MIGELAIDRQIYILRVICESQTILYEQLMRKVLDKNMKICSKTFHVDSSLWDLVEQELIIHNYGDTYIDSYSITQKGEEFIRLYNIKE